MHLHVVVGAEEAGNHGVVVFICTFWLDPKSAKKVKAHRNSARSTLLSFSFCLIKFYEISVKQHTDE